MASSGLHIKSFDDLSGRVGAIEIGTYQERKAKEANEDMVKRGLKPVDLRTFSTATEATAVLRAGQVEVVIIVEDAACPPVGPVGPAEAAMLEAALGALVPDRPAAGRDGLYEPRRP